MPFSQASNGKKDLIKKDLDYIYKEIIKKGVEEFEVDGKKYFDEVLRYDEKVGSIIKGIVQKLKDADLVIADLTGLNPNVMYELGVRHALKRGTIMLTQDFSYFPSDLRDYMTVVYGFSSDIHEQPINYENFKRDLHKNISELLKSEKVDSPVLEYIEKKEFYKNENDVKDLKEMVLMLESLYEDFNDIAGLIQAIDNGNEVDESVSRELISFYLNCFHSKLQSFQIPISTNLLYEDLINLASLLTEVLKKIAISDYFQTLPPQIRHEFPTPSLKATLKETVLDPVHLKIEQKIRYCEIRNLFTQNEFLYSFLEDVETYIESEAQRLGVVNEIDNMLESMEST